jgi:hypothetical protein
MEWLGVNLIQCNQPKGFKEKMTGHKLRNGVYWQRVLKQKGIKHVRHIEMDTYMCH